MANAGNVRKLFIDSRYKVSGTDSDFVVELPVDVDTTRTSSFFVASCSFANTYQTVTPYNNIFWYLEVLPLIGTPFVYGHTIPPGSYDPESLATALAAILESSARLSNVGVTFDPDIGNYTVTYTSAATLVIPNYADIDKYAVNAGIDQSSAPWVAWTRGSKYQSVNSLLNTPLQYPSISYFTSGFKTGIVDLAPLREVYLHCSLANSRTLSCNGSRDCIARIPIDVSFGEVVTYRHMGPSDALSCSDVHFRTLSFQLRDWTGRLAPNGSFVVIELCFLDADPYAM